MFGYLRLNWASSARVNRVYWLIQKLKQYLLKTPWCTETMKLNWLRARALYLLNNLYVSSSAHMPTPHTNGIQYHHIISTSNALFFHSQHNSLLPETPFCVMILDVGFYRPLFGDRFTSHALESVHWPNRVCDWIRRSTIESIATELALKGETAGQKALAKESSWKVNMTSFSLLGIPSSYLFPCILS